MCLIVWNKFTNVWKKVECHLMLKVSIPTAVMFLHEKYTHVEVLVLQWSNGKQVKSQSDYFECFFFSFFSSPALPSPTSLTVTHKIIMAGPGTSLDQTVMKTWLLITETRQATLSKVSIALQKNETNKNKGRECTFGGVYTPCIYSPARLSYCGRFGSLLLCLCGVFKALISSLWLCRN